MDAVSDLLKKKNIYFVASGRDYKISCLNPEHDDSDPSLRIDKLTGDMHCFACGFKGNIFKFYKLTGYFNSVRLARLKDKLKTLNITFNGVDFPYEQIPMTRPFRGISVKTLKHFGAFYTLAEEKLVDRLFFPIKDIRGKVLVYVGRHMLSQGNPRYLNYPGNCIMPVFPEILEEKTETLVLVEGLFDFLNCYDKGLRNVACTFGTNTLLGEAEHKLLPFKVQGVKKIFLMFDGDEAGREGMSKAQPVLEELGFIVEQIKLEEGTDPGEFSQEYVDSIKEYVTAPL
ncbi:Archaeal primase DnaG/twinkle, TOPRIM domain [uncultured Caudovirales phage]|uniref:Archaeal primase DnaG/twinkle, TOPRIM domain n=1 Tax=uncultured Caudovirales phage TaxID=2100421 RepID=A0A6J5LMM6_9CAUD|nr:Archaeal primase DnaG/twinkle, TOPRIM domain [uncultured Caudovirales phage]